jgi:hypothetical protein
VAAAFSLFRHVSKLATLPLMDRTEARRYLSEVCDWLMPNRGAYQCDFD